MPNLAKIWNLATSEIRTCLFRNRYWLSRNTLHVNGNVGLLHLNKCYVRQIKRSLGLESYVEALLWLYHFCFAKCVQVKVDGVIAAIGCYCRVVYFYDCCVTEGMLRNLENGFNLMFWRKQNMKFHCLMGNTVDINIVIEKSKEDFFSWYTFFFFFLICFKNIEVDICEILRIC